MATDATFCGCFPRQHSGSENPNIDVHDIEIDFCQGLGILPDEMLTHVLAFVPDKDLKHCLIVCQTWAHIISGQTLWRTKCLQTSRFVEDLHAPFYPNDWREFYFKAPYTGNLIKNCSGQDNLKGWNILENGGNQWKIETERNGSDPLPEEALALSNNQSFNFATSYGWCTAEQVIDLVKEGISEELLDHAQPDILVTEWYAARFDCGNTYEMSVKLLNKPNNADENVMEDFEYGPITTPQWAPRNWNKVEHTFSNYGPGLRYIHFLHKGKDTQFWAGHYGSKMAGAQVRLQFRKDMEVKSTSDRAAKKNAEAELTLKGDEEDIYD